MSTEETPTRRRRGSRRRRHRRRVSVAISLAIIIGFVAVMGALLARDVVRLRAEVATASSLVELARTHVLDGEVEEARRTLAKARANTGRAGARTDRPLWRAAERVPLAGRSLRTIADTVAVLDLGLDFGRSLIAATSGIALEDSSGFTVTDGRIDMSPIRTTIRELTDVDPAGLVAAAANLRDQSTWLVPSAILDARRATLDLIGDTVSTYDRAHGLLAVLPALLGDDEPRSYFLAMQNPAELRGTGGFLGYFATVTVDRGRFVLSDPEEYTALGTVFTQDSVVAEALRGSGVFEDRYGPASASSFLANANVDPDVPTSAASILTLYEALKGEQLDGVIMVDPIALGEVLRVIGPVELASDVAPQRSRLASPITGNRIAEAILIDEYEVFGGASDARKEWLEAVVTASFEALFSRSWDPVAMGGRLGRLSGEGHLQMYSRHPQEQEAIQATRLGGALRHRPGTDLVSVTANNVAANKSDVHVAHRTNLTVRLSPDAAGGFRRSADLRVEVLNPLPTEGRDEYIIGSAPQTTGRSTGLTGPRGLNRTWFSVWVPPDAQIFEIRDENHDTVPAGVFRIHDTRVVDHVMETPSMSSRSFTTSWSGDAHVVATEGEFVYRLRWQRQPKAIADRVRLEVNVPAGHRVVAAELRGGGNGAGLGPDGERGPRATVSIRGNTVLIEGDLSADLELVLRFAVR